MTSNNQVLKVLRGLPQSGKTTLANAWVAEDPGWRARVSRDDIATQLYGSPHFLNRHQTETVATVEHNMVTTLLKAKLSVVVDSVNLRIRDVQDWQSKSAKTSIPLEIEDVWAVPGDASKSLNLCIKRYKENFVGVDGEAIVRDYFGRYVVKGKYPIIPEMVSDQEATGEWQTYVPDESLPDAYIFDIDGTIAQMFGRSPFAWDRVGEDEPITNVIEVAKALHKAGFEIVLVSGRDVVCFDITSSWLEVSEVIHSALHMKPLNSKQADDKFKHEVFYKEIAPKYNVRGVFDDRLRVCRMWEEIGLTLFRVGPIDADF